ncbi:MAG: DUF2997 domain-containing protein [Nitrospirae bacterium]|nr:DUF2997 domain-containing protein [Nitrospirota bacterium]
MKKKIEITFSPEGEVKVETKGFAGKSCLDASKFIEEALGQKGSVSTTADYYSSDIQNSQSIDRS